MKLLSIALFSICFFGCKEIENEILENHRTEINYLDISEGKYYYFYSKDDYIYEWKVDVRPEFDDEETLRELKKPKGNPGNTAYWQDNENLSARAGWNKLLKYKIRGDTVIFLTESKGVAIGNEIEYEEARFLCDFDFYYLFSEKNAYYLSIPYEGNRYRGSRPELIFKSPNFEE